MYSLYNNTWLLASSGPPSSLLSTPLTNYHPRRHLQRLLEHRQGACPVASCSLAVWLSSDSSKELGVRGGPRGIFHLCFEACLFPMGRNNVSLQPPQASHPHQYTQCPAPVGTYHILTHVIILFMSSRFHHYQFL